MNNIPPIRFLEIMSNHYVNNLKQLRLELKESVEEEDTENLREICKAKYQLVVDYQIAIHLLKTGELPHNEHIDKHHPNFVKYNIDDNSQ